MIYDQFCIQENEKILSALKKIDNNNKGFLIVIDFHEKVVGTLTDGDIRRAFINQYSIFDSITNIYNKNFKKVSIDADFSDIIELFKNNKIEFVPILTKQGRLHNLITKKNMHVLLLEDIDFDFNYDFIALNDEALEHEIYNRPWGFYKTTLLNEYSQSKIIKVYPGKELSLQEHKKREEYWVIIHGIGEVIIGESRKRVEAGNYIYIPKGCKHKLINTSDYASLMVAEVQLGDYFGEDDIIRYQDAYGRR